VPIVNPFGGAPVFLAMTADCSPELRRVLARRIAVNAFLLLLGSVFVGTYVLDFFGLSVPVVQVAGGILVSVLGWDLLRQDATASPLTIFGAGGADTATRAFYPLTLPLTVGPGSISVGVTIGANHAQGMRSLLINVRAGGRRGMIAATCSLLPLRRPHAQGARVDRHQRADPAIRVHPVLHRRADLLEWCERAAGRHARPLSPCRGSPACPARVGVAGGTGIICCSAAARGRLARAGTHHGLL
jgi:small neutral amino acid transporter SnatA (MarC family)